MKIRIAVAGFIVVLSAVVFFFLENRGVNQLINDQEYPVQETVRESPVSLNKTAVKIDGTGIEMTKIYTIQEAEELYFGFWYGKNNDLMTNDKKSWYRDQGVPQFLVKAVDAQGTTYNGTTTGKTEGTFSTFQYVKIADYNHHKDIEELSFSFYPLKKQDGTTIPKEDPLFEVTVPLDRYE